jgi:hypothetical protein
VQGYQRAGLVTTDELTLIKKVDRQPRAKTESLLLSDGQSYALLYLRLLKKLQRIDTMQCILVLIADALVGSSPAQHMPNSRCRKLRRTYQITKNEYRCSRGLLKSILTSHTGRYSGVFKRQPSVSYSPAFQNSRYARRLCPPESCPDSHRAPQVRQTHPLSRLIQD